MDSHVICNLEQFYFFFSEIYTFYYPLIALSRTSNTMLNTSGRCGHPCLVLKFSGKTFNLSLLSMILSVGLSYFVETCSLYYAEIFSLYTHFDKSVYHERMTFTCGS